MKVVVEVQGKLCDLIPALTNSSVLTRMSKKETFIHFWHLKLFFFTSFLPFFGVSTESTEEDSSSGL